MGKKSTPIDTEQPEFEISKNDMKKRRGKELGGFLHRIAKDEASKEIADEIKKMSKEESKQYLKDMRLMRQLTLGSSVKDLKKANCMRFYSNWMSYLNENGYPSNDIPDAGARVYMRTLTPELRALMVNQTQHWDKVVSGIDYIIILYMDPLDVPKLKEKGEEWLNDATVTGVDTRHWPLVSMAREDHKSKQIHAITNCHYSKLSDTQLLMLKYAWKIGREIEMEEELNPMYDHMEEIEPTRREARTLASKLPLNASLLLGENDQVYVEHEFSIIMDKGIKRDWQKMMKDTFGNVHSEDGGFCSTVKGQPEMCLIKVDDDLLDIKYYNQGGETNIMDTFKVLLEDPQYIRTPKQRKSHSMSIENDQRNIIDRKFFNVTEMFQDHLNNYLLSLRRGGFANKKTEGDAKSTPRSPALLSH